MGFVPQPNLRNSPTDSLQVWVNLTKSRVILCNRVYIYPMGLLGFVPQPNLGSSPTDSLQVWVNLTKSRVILCNRVYIYP
ncbi:hypothetical protein, partial [Cylindrospermopsis raciborskii]|uniref:hypothetical protein n=1 Tax=Cylindrospermopsis raciborskii TaxID=77022 RepID=UPI001CA501DD